MEITLLNAASRDGDLAFQRRCQTEHNTSFHLSGNRVWIHVAAAINGADYAMNAHFAGAAIDTYFRDLRGETSK